MWTQTHGQAGKDYVTFIGSDFVQEGQRVADWLVKDTNGTRQDHRARRHAGAVAGQRPQEGLRRRRSRGQRRHDRSWPRSRGDFARDKGRQVMETLLQAHPEVTAVYAHNDEMAHRRHRCAEAAGKKPGKDVIVVSIDGEKDGMQAVVDGKLGATVECNPRFGPKAFDTLVSYAKGDAVPPKIINTDQFFDASNAKENVAKSY